MISNFNRIVRGSKLIKILISPVHYLLMKLLWEPVYWKKRVEDVINCPDIKFIPTVPNAGKVKDGLLIMHNGLKIEPLSYYGYRMVKLFKTSKGIHEPQEERIFLEVLKKLRKGALMLELGSYWAFYSMWFHEAVPEAQNFMVEPSTPGIDFGKRNFFINNMQGDFTRSYIARKSDNAPDGTRIVCIDDFIIEKNIPFIDILHSDIQGFEVEMIEGATNLLLAKKVGYIFISSHSNELHDECIRLLKSYDYIILHSINLDETYSLDGLIVAVSPDYPQINSITLSKKQIL